MDPLFFSIVLLLLGLVFLVLEIFIPSGGALGLFAGLSLVASVAVAFTGGAKLGTLTLLAVLVVAPAVLMIGVRVWPSTPLGRRILGEPQDPAEILPNTKESQNRQQLLGQYGIANTNMRPNGWVMIDGQGYDAISEGMPIDAGQRLRVVAVRTNRIVVSPVDRLPPGDDEAGESLLSRPIEELGLEPFDSPLT